jgi:murein DD-endopeptidase MepM/ murein hydrolase activator NlpD
MPGRTRVMFHRRIALAAVALAACADPSGPGPPASVTLFSATDVLVEGWSLQLSARALDAGGHTVATSEPSWFARAPTVAQVDGAGTLMAKSSGEAWVGVEMGGHRDSMLVRVAPREVPLLRRPFDADPPLLNAFDHYLPLWPAANPVGVIDWRGGPVEGIDGHRGYDWLLADGEPVVAASDGRVRFAGAEEPWPCPLLGGDTVAANVVRIRHATADDAFHSVYIHLSRVDVAVDDTVQAGDVIGLSGNTGCSTVPHLHFEVARLRYWRVPREGYVKVMDPSGWAGRGIDPWVLDPTGVASSRLWIPGEEPELVRGGVLALPFRVPGPVGPSRSPVDRRRSDLLEAW